ncbi:hypothetical protein ES288_A03G071700v1 [Gossypium darwinii]|uniref:Uncharacterized protein n=1 Tax=Gossypium darwinii TaxID=34276 RepID=A0A5D2H2S1_GOSDA|nr:hypothetical protein ES288_A03G071700v1 [Gossypium darwinii]
MMLLELCRNVLPEGNKCPASFHETKLLRTLGLGYFNIDVCCYDCCVFYMELEHANECPMWHNT